MSTPIPDAPSNEPTPPDSQPVEDKVSEASEEELDGPVTPKDMDTARQAYEGGIIKPAKETKYPAIDSLLDRVSIFQGDITDLAVDSIVNAANTRLLGGGGVDGAIHRAAGPGLLQECQELNGAETGESKITGGYRLPSRFIIHTVGPVYYNGEAAAKAVLLESCYKTSLDLAVEFSLKHIAFPSVSTGVYGYPIVDATRIALDVIRRFLETDKTIERVICVVWSNKDRDVYRKLLPEYFPLPVEEEPKAATTDAEEILGPALDSAPGPSEAKEVDRPVSSSEPAGPDSGPK